ncbi:FAD/NAD(P)-binding domain-containing protein [Sistotremastrum niveocremeum HHB9708]|uniref:FAD/NAD(P)-binding domain-containing protein n=1 Tax=Sistotremastrum niveocremeum HHB9708 TaxID=1314777 RepID=A0A164YGU7_9AGAM|nr:FAD/NAD(P)-binding domain-containing protein [Sistotremastrum niveocremeum HHB9708]
MLYSPQFDTPLNFPRKLRVICVGAGISGIGFAYQLTRNLENVDLVIYEKNSDVGGCWFENQYPGCQCDVPSHSYTFSWDGNPRWNKYWASWSEIQHYLRGCVDKWYLNKFLKLNHRLVSARWDTEESKWHLEIATPTGRIIRDSADVFFDATGALNRWKWPTIKGLDKFKGHLVHSAAWDHSYDFTGKRVLLIGGGPSGVQITPQLAPIVTHLTHHIRSPLYVPEMRGQNDSPENGYYSEAEKDKFTFDPEYFLQYRKHQTEARFGSFLVSHKDSELQRETRKKVQESMRQRLQYREDLCKKLIPEWEYGCKRSVPGTYFLETLLRPNVRVLAGEILEIKEHSVITEEAGEDQYDAIICATGFDTSYIPSFPIIGRHGINLQDEWAGRVEHYLSVAVHGYPNYFMGSGPNNSTNVVTIQTGAAYAVQCIEKIQKEAIRSLEITYDAVNDFTIHRDLFVKDMVWTGACSSWYKNGTKDGPVLGPWVGSGLHYLAALGKPRFEDYRIRYVHGNRFAYLGNGQTQDEIEGKNLSWFIRQDP